MESLRKLRCFGLAEGDPSLPVVTCSPPPRLGLPSTSGPPVAVPPPPVALKCRYPLACECLMAGRGVDGSHPVSSDEDELSESSLDEDGTVHQRHNDKQKVETLLVCTKAGRGIIFSWASD